MVKHPYAAREEYVKVGVAAGCVQDDRTTLNLVSGHELTCQYVRACLTTSQQTYYPFGMRHRHPETNGMPILAKGFPSSSNESGGRAVQLSQLKICGERGMVEIDMWPCSQR